MWRHARRKTACTSTARASSASMSFSTACTTRGEGPTAYGQVDMRWVDGNTLLVGYYAQRGAAATPETAMSFQMLSQYDIPEEPPAKSYIMLFENGRHRPFDMVWTSSLFDERGGAS